MTNTPRRKDFTENSMQKINSKKNEKRISIMLTRSQPHNHNSLSKKSKLLRKKLRKILPSNSRLSISPPSQIKIIKRRVFFIRRNFNLMTVISLFHRKRKVSHKARRLLQLM